MLLRGDFGEWREFGGTIGRLVRAGGSAVELSPATRESRNQKVVTCSLTQAMCFDA
ncbi:hypothetical protein Ciccas_014471, partial [Cichlidogyrus casuarinus]